MSYVEKTNEFYENNIYKEILFFAASPLKLIEKIDDVYFCDRRLSNLETLAEPFAFIGLPLIAISLVPSVAIAGCLAIVAFALHALSLLTAGIADRCTESSVGMPVVKN